ncbi:MAG: hypothetical protein ACRDDJ_09565, partial [[Mycobacterium] stephanolepidis]
MTLSDSLRAGRSSSEVRASSPLAAPGIGKTPKPIPSSTSKLHWVPTFFGWLVGVFAAMIFLS